MADLDPLIRVRRHALEQKQKFLAELYRQAEELSGQKKALEIQMREEQDIVTQMDAVEMLSYFGAYTQAVKARIAEIEEAMVTLEARINIAREDMREAFAEFKKIEITQEKREAEEDAAQQRRENQILDEIGIEAYRRRQDEGG